MHRTHSYTATCAWKGSTALGYQSYSREHRAEAPPAKPLLLSADPSFLGDPADLNPEQLLVMAASSCQLLSFLAVAARARIDVREYYDNAEGLMPDTSEPKRITEIILRPQIVINEIQVGATDLRDRVLRLVELAHKECYIANSLTAKIAIEPEVLTISSQN